MSAFFSAFALVFVAELGDKSQLLTVLFATRYRWWTVIAGVTVAALALNLLAALIGTSVAAFAPESLILLAVGLLFYCFAVLALLPSGRDSHVTADSPRVAGGFRVVAVSFFLAELGDKTQLATIALAGNLNAFFGVWLGSTAGIVAADSLAIAVGIVAGRRIPRRLFAMAAAGLFVLFGTLSLARGMMLLLE